MRRAQPSPGLLTLVTLHISLNHSAYHHSLLGFRSYPSIVLSRYPLVAELASVAWSAGAVDPGLGAVVALASVPTWVGVAGASSVLAPVV